MLTLLRPLFLVLSSNSTRTRRLWLLSTAQMEGGRWEGASCQWKRRLPVGVVALTQDRPCAFGQQEAWNPEDTVMIGPRVAATPFSLLSSEPAHKPYVNTHFVSLESLGHIDGGVLLSGILLTSKLYVRAHVCECLLKI